MDETRSRLWSARDADDPTVQIQCDGHRVRTEGLDTDIDVDADAFRSGGHDDLIRTHFGVEELVTLHALTEAELETEPPPRRPRLQFRWSWSEKPGGLVFLERGKLSVRIHGEDRFSWDAPMSAIAEDGLPEHVAEALGPERTRDVLETVRQALTLDCYCGTGFERANQPPDLACVEEISDSNIPLDNGTGSYVCEVCGRGWICSYMGDSHYSYQYDADWIDPNRQV